jgi:DNA-directed RNA polymerase specialized sigma24 family protein
VAKNILRERARRDRTRKRGGGVRFVPLDEDAAHSSPYGPAGETESEQQATFDREWAGHSLSTALRRSAAEPGPPYAESVRLFLDGHSILKIAESLGTDAQNVKNHLRRGRSRPARHVQLEVEAYCDGDSEWREEMRRLSRFLSTR